MDMEKYTQERQALIKEYNLKKLKNVLAVLGIGGAVVVVILLVGGLLLGNIPVTAVLALIAGIFTILYARIRTVTVNHALEKKLHQFEDAQLLKKYYIIKGGVDFLHILFSYSLPQLSIRRGFSFMIFSAVCLGKRGRIVWKQ